VDVLLVREGGGWDMDAAAILKAAPRPAVARRLLEFAASHRAIEVYAQFIQQVAIEGIAKPIKNDLVRAAENRDRIIAEWQRRYGKR